MQITANTCDTTITITRDEYDVLIGKETLYDNLVNIIQVKGAGECLLTSELANLLGIPEVYKAMKEAKENK